MDVDFESLTTPVVVVGGGAAGLMTALELAPLPVTVVASSPLGEHAATAWAQGGIASAISADDSPVDHARDTLAAAGELGDAAVAALVTSAAPACVAKLEVLGVRFDHHADGTLALGREGGHGKRRIVHASGDGTGREIMRALVSKVRQVPSITVLEGHTAADLIFDAGRVRGVWTHRGGTLVAISASAVVLATGGIGGLYRRTTNPTTARGDGLAIAARAGAQLADLEFVQFHPTALDLGRDPMPLATEALRGDGAVVIDDQGDRVLRSAHPDAELAPRDVVARAIWSRIAEGRRVFLDARESLGTRFAERYPTVYASCREAGLDPAHEPMPVVPAAHYHMGGVAVDVDGRSSIPSLWAVGEVAATGLHGANRLASNSLLEALVFATRVAASVADERPSNPNTPAPVILPQHRRVGSMGPDLMRLRDLMTNGVGVVRDEDGLTSAISTLVTMRDRAHRDSLALENAVTTALLIAATALERRETRGSHARRDFPLTDNALRRRTFTTLSQVEDLALGRSASTVHEGRP